MKYRWIFLLVGVICACEESNNPSTEIVEEMIALEASIMETLSSSSCEDSDQCLYRGFGSKPCGGPWLYLIYSSSIDTASLHEQINRYGELEARLNTLEGRVSDCSVPAPPDSVVCENGACVGYLEGSRFPDHVCCVQQK